VTEPDNDALLPMLRAQQKPPAVAEAVEQAGQVALGAALLLTDGLAAVFRKAEESTPAAAHDHGPTPAVAARRVAVGMAFGAQRRVVGVVDATTKVVGPTVAWLASTAPAQPLVRQVAERLDRAYQAGLLEEESARDLAARSGEITVQLAVPLVLDEIDLVPVVDKVLGQLDLPSLVGTVMDELDLDPIVQRVLGQLDLPSLVNEVVGEMQMSSVVMQATGGITEDVLDGVRGRSADGDAVIERIVAKVLRRKVEALPPAGVPGPDAQPVEDQP
jgi:hypothetical protein